MRGLNLLVVLSVFAAGARAENLTDLAGRSVRLPENIRSVACLEVLCYPTLFMLGVEDRVEVMTRTTAPWLVATNAGAAAIAPVGTEADVEDLAARKIDLAFFSYNVNRILPKLEAIRLPALVSQQTGKPPRTQEEYVARSKATIMLFGRAFGGEALVRAEDYCAWFDEKRAYVAARIAKIAPERRRKLFYVRGPRTQNTHNKFAYVYWLGVLAGAHMVVGDGALASGPVNMEDILNWDPDVVIVGRQYPVDLVADDPRWRNVSALRHGEVHPSPAGVFYWDGGPESALMMLFIAKTLYPDLFPDIDMKAEITGFYARFYRFALTDDQAQKILLGESPDGSRLMSVNN